LRAVQVYFKFKNITATDLRFGTYDDKKGDELSPFPTNDIKA